MSISHRARRACTSVCLVKKFKDLEEQRVWVKFCFKLGGGDFYGDFSDVATGLWRGLFEPYAMPRVVPMFQIVAERPSKKTPNLDGLPR